MDRAGWHIAGDLNVPDHLTPIFLPPYSPELNAIEGSIGPSTTSNTAHIKF